MKWLKIGISGPTCSGKTSLAKKLQEYIQDSVLISQDTYFLAEDNPKHTLIPELNHFNWEILSSLDMSKMHSDILKIIETPMAHLIGSNNKFRCLIIEGFLIFNYKPIVDLCDLKYFIEINRGECWKRRQHRVYQPPDVPGYFDKVVWPEYIKHKSELISDIDLCKTITFLDGSKSINEQFDVIRNEIEAAYVN